VEVIKREGRKRKEVYAIKYARSYVQESDHTDRCRYIEIHGVIEW
jgi:hypothetical protein